MLGGSCVFRLGLCGSLYCGREFYAQIPRRSHRGVRGHSSDLVAAGVGTIIDPLVVVPAALLTPVPTLLTCLYMSRTAHAMDSVTVAGHSTCSTRRHTRVQVGLAVAIACFIALLIKWCVENKGFPIKRINDHGPVQVGRGIALQRRHGAAGSWGQTWMSSALCSAQTLPDCSWWRCTSS